MVYEAVHRLLGEAEAAGLLTLERRPYSRGDLQRAAIVFCLERDENMRRFILAEAADKRTVEFKEALVMALLGVLRWREEDTVLSTVTGASRPSIGGALWMGSK